MEADAQARPLSIGSEIYRRSTYGPGRPLAIPRVSSCTDLCRALGWLPAAAYLDASADRERCTLRDVPREGVIRPAIQALAALTLKETISA